MITDVADCHPTLPSSHMESLDCCVGPHIVALVTLLLQVAVSFPCHLASKNRSCSILAAGHYCRNSGSIPMKHYSWLSSAEMVSMSGLPHAHNVLRAQNHCLKCPCTTGP